MMQFNGKPPKFKDTIIKAPQPPWRERFRELEGIWTLGGKQLEALKAFIEKELELEREDETERLRFYTKETRRVALSQVKEIIKGMENVEDTEAKGWEILENGRRSCCPADDIWLGYETALQDILKKLDEL